MSYTTGADCGSSKYSTRSKYSNYSLELSPTNDRRSRSYCSVPRSTTIQVSRQSSRLTDVNGNVRALSLSKSLSPSSYTANSLIRDTKTLSLGNEKRYNDTKKRLDALYNSRSSAYLNKSYSSLSRANNLSYFEKYNKQQPSDTSQDQPKHVNMNRRYTDNYTDSLSSVYNGRQQQQPDVKKGVAGIRNIGNTCYMNSVLQCLSNTKSLTDYVLEDNTTDGKLIKVYRDLLSRIWTGHESPVDTTAFKSAFQRLSPRFAGYEQQDSQEFLRLLLDKLHIDINRVKLKSRNLSDVDDTLKDNALAAEYWRRYLASDNSTVVDLFAGQLKSTLECSVCRHKSITFEAFWDLSLPLPSGTTDQVSLTDLLANFTQEEVLDFREKPRCSKCKVDQKMYKSYSFQKLPRYLVLHLKRFQGTHSYKKITSLVSFPLVSLDMSPFVSSSARAIQSHTKYNLYAVSNHSGTPIAGHYTAFCKNPISGDWHFFNDSSVSKIISPTKIISNEAYILFYEAVSGH
ncbi:ubiquitin carboxyl-terminal hydrolase 2-like [Daktulosphaira vitifoliae]|uniref:ubiquitin carboxyl-terminal hydrolase 2-like n=1 Tax=Daktulosphaira vitifoliae TaxID=58002 RepID=UPI0021A97E57|nr:ubiquitin carboxyl-terminal hydrolase 2-like [Daktulosphaira vitifoliae]